MGFFLLNMRGSQHIFVVDKIEGFVVRATNVHPKKFHYAMHRNNKLPGAKMPEFPMKNN